MGSSGLPQTGVELVAQNLQGFMGALQTGNQAVNQFGQHMDDAGKRTSSAGQIMVGALRQVGAMATNALLQAGRALIGFGQDSLRLAGDFDQGMQQFKVAAGNGLDTKGIEEFHDLFLQLGKDLPVSTSEVQTAAVEMVKGGLDPAILAAGGLKQNIQFAAAAMSGDLVGAATISAKVVAGWAEVGATAQDKATLLAHATDLLTKAANASSVDVHELSLGLFNVQATAKNAGIGLDDVTTVLAELSGDFASSSEAGNSMASFITRLHPQTKAATQAMESLGLVTKEGGNAFYDAQGNFVGFQKASEILKESLKGLNNEQKQQIMQTIFQKDAMGVAAGLASRGADGYQAMADSLKNAMGVAAAGTTVQQGYNTAVENATGGLEALKITLGEKLLPYLTTFYTFLNDKVLTTLINVTDAIFGNQKAYDSLSPTLKGLVDGFDVFVADFQEIIGAFNDAGASSDAFATSIGVLADDLGLPGGIIKEIVASIQELADHWDEITAAFESSLPTLEAVAVALGTFAIISTVAGWIETLMTSWGALTAVFAAAEGPIAGIVAVLGGPVTVALGAIALAIGVLYLAWTNDWGGIQEKAAAVWDFLKPIFDQAVAWLSVEIPKAIQVAADFWTTTLWPALQKVGAFFTDTIFPILGQLANVWLKMAGAEVSALSTLWTNVLWPALKVVGAFIGDVLWPIFQKLFEVEFAIAQKVVEALAGLWEKVLWPALQKVGSYISETVIPIFSKIGSYISDTFSPILKTATDWLTKVTGGFNGVATAVKWVTDHLDTLASGISNLKLPSWLTPHSPTPWEVALIGIGTAMSKSVVPGLTAMQSGIEQIGGKINETFANSDIVDSLATLGQNAMEGFGQGIKDGYGEIKKLVASTAAKVKSAFEGAFQSHSPSQLMVPIGNSVVEGVIQGIQDSWPDITTLMAGIGDDMIKQAKSISQDVQDALAEGFGATASMDRQKLSNLKNLGGISDKGKTDVQQQLEDAEKIANAMNDPQKAQEYFKLRSQQIFEIARIQDQLNTGLNAKQEESYRYQIDMLKQNAEDVQKAADQGLITQAEADRIREDDAKRIADMEAALQGSLTEQQRSDLEAQLALIQAAQQAELQQFNASNQGGGTIQHLIDTINQMMMDSGLGILDAPALAHLSGLIDQLRALQQSAGTGLGTGTGSYAPPMGGAQYPPPPGGAVQNTNSTSYNMPIYTNNSPQALQQSFAVLRASAMR